MLSFVIALGSFQPDVALPLIVQSVKDSKSDVGVRLNRNKRQEAKKEVSIDLSLKPFRSETRNPKRSTL